MADPATSGTTSLVTIAIVAIGPAAGPWAIVVLAALAGAQWALSKESDASMRRNAWIVLRCVFSSTVLTSSAAWSIEQIYGVSSPELWAPVAFFIAALGERVHPVLDVAATGVSGAVARFVDRVFGPAKGSK